MLQAESGSPGDHFGTSVSIDGEHVLIGAPGADGSVPDSGAAYYFHHGVKPPDPNPPSPPSPDPISPINEGTDTGDTSYDPDDDPDEEEPDEEGDEGTGDSGTGGYDPGETTPPGDSSELFIEETEPVDYFDPENMMTSFQLPNGEYQVSMNARLSSDVFQEAADQNFLQETAKDGSSTPPETMMTDHTFAQAEAQAVQSAGAIVENLVGNIGDAELEEPEIEDPESPSGNDAVDQAVDRLFLSDFIGDGTVPELVPAGTDAPDAGHPQFRDSISDSLDFLLKE
jgi:hypothetical protein